MNKRVFIILAIFAIFSIFSQDKNVINVKNRGVARVGKNIITESELERTFTEMNNLASVYGKNVTKKEVLEAIIDNYLLKDKIKSEPLVLDEAQYVNQLNMIKQQYIMMRQAQNQNYQYSDADFKNYIEKEGKISFEEFQNKIKERVLLNQYIQKISQSRLQELYKKTFETSKDFPVKIPTVDGRFETYNSLREIYDQNEENFIVPAHVVLKHIFFNTTLPDGSQMKPEDKKAIREKAEDVYKRLKNGEDFNKLCLLYSDDPTSKTEEEDPETKQKHRGFIGQMFLTGKYSKLVREKWGDQIFTLFGTLKKGDISTVQESKYGYHIFYVIDKKDRGFISFEQAKPTLIQQLRAINEQLILQEVYTNLIKELRSKTEIVYLAKEYESK